MSELEVGCKAIVIGGMPDNVGKIVTILLFIGTDDKEDGIKGNDIWETDTKLTVGHFDNINIPDGKSVLENAVNMRRIDDHNTDEYFQKELSLTTH
jgi:hypothetical protein